MCQARRAGHLTLKPTSSSSPTRQCAKKGMLAEWMCGCPPSVFSPLCLQHRPLWHPSSSSLSSAGGSSLLLKIVGVTRHVCTFNASARLAVPAGDPNDMGLPEYELHSDLLRPLSKPWWGGVHDRRPWHQVQEFILSVHHRRHLGKNAHLSQVKGWNYGWRLAVVRQCPRPFCS